MTPEEQGLKDFMLNYFDFDSMKEMGFYGKDIKRKDYQKQADRICWYFSLDSVFEYIMIGNGCGVHISTIDSTFKCPVCDCEQEVPGSKDPVYKIKCAGCKRQLEVSPNGYDKYSVVEVGGFKEKTVTYDENKSFLYKRP